MGAELENCVGLSASCGVSVSQQWSQQLVARQRLKMSGV